MTTDLQRAHVEVRRCRANLLAGGSRKFWEGRLSLAISHYEATIAVLREQLNKLNSNFCACGKTGTGPGLKLGEPWCDDCRRAALSAPLAAPRDEGKP